jgi:multimeric flavodoxin WrbA
LIMLHRHPYDTIGPRHCQVTSPSRSSDDTGNGNPSLHITTPPWYTACVASVDNNTEPIRVLGIAGSPRRNGNTEALLDRFLSGAEGAGAAVEKIVVARLKIAGCVACDGCWDDGQCVVRDDFQSVYDKLIVADVIALAAPLFFWNLPSQVKALIDRSQCQWARKFVLKAPLAATPAGHARRRGVFICVGGAPQPDFSGAVPTVKGFFAVHEAEYWGELLCGNVDTRGEISRHPTALQEAFALGVRAVEEAWE